MPTLGGSRKETDHQQPTETIMLLPLAFADHGAASDEMARGRASIFPGAAQPPLQLRLELPPRVHAREPVPLRLVLQNHGLQAEEVDLSGETVAFDIVVFSLDGFEVWSRLEIVLMPRVLQTRTLAPGESLAFTDAWLQRDRSGRQVAPGTYMLQGILPVAGVPGGWGTDLYMLAILP
jgi:hypothetical protein